MTDTALDEQAIRVLLDGAFGSWSPPAVILLRYPDGWQVSAAFQSAIRALRYLERSDYDKPHALYCVAPDDPGYIIEFFKADI